MNVTRNAGREVILKDHRRWTRWVSGPFYLGEGNLTLTNRRVLFLHRITSNPSLTENMKRLAGSPTEAVLDYAFTLNKKNFQIPLSRIARVGTGLYFRFLLPHFYLKLSYYEGKKNNLRDVSFRFRWIPLDAPLHPQVVENWKWARAIRKAVSENNLHEDPTLTGAESE